MKVDIELLERLASERTKGVWAIGDLYEERINKFSRSDEDFFIAVEKNIDAMIAELQASREVVAAAEQLEEFFSDEDRDMIEKVLEKYKEAVK